MNGAPTPDSLEDLPEIVEVRRAPLRAFVFVLVIVLPVWFVLVAWLLIVLVPGGDPGLIWGLVVIAAVGMLSSWAVWTLLARPVFHTAPALILYREGIEIPLYHPGRIYAWSQVRLVRDAGIWPRPFLLYLSDADHCDFKQSNWLRAVFRRLGLFRSAFDHGAYVGLPDIYRLTHGRIRRLIRLYTLASARASQDRTRYFQPPAQAEAPPPIGDLVINWSAYGGNILGTVLVIGAMAVAGWQIREPAPAPADAQAGTGEGVVQLETRLRVLQRPAP